MNRGQFIAVQIKRSILRSELINKTGFKWGGLDFEGRILLTEPAFSGRPHHRLFFNQFLRVNYFSVHDQLGHVHSGSQLVQAFYLDDGVALGNIRLFG